MNVHEIFYKKANVESFGISISFWENYVWNIKDKTRMGPSWHVLDY